MAQTGRVTPAQERAIAALVGGASLQDAAKAAKCSDRSLRRWRYEDAAFQARLAEAQNETYSMTINRIVTASTVAIATLAKIAKNEKAPAAARVSASVAILTHAHQNYRTTMLEARMAELEAVMGSGHD